MKLYPIHEVNEKRLAIVIEQMRQLGSPTIRAVSFRDSLVAIEGSHRLKAAYLSQTPVKLVVLDRNEWVSASSLDWLNLLEDEKYPAGDLAWTAYENSPGPYEYNPETLLLSIEETTSS